jgi:hypothetical protein
VEEHASPALSALLYGGPILFLLTQAWNLRTVLRVTPRVQVVGSVVLLGLGVASLAAPAYVALLGAATGLAALALFEGRTR